MAVKNGNSHLLNAAFDHCARITSDHYENFPVASWLLPRQVRPHVCSIYAFARTADDFADEPGLEPAERIARLEDWKRRLETCKTAPEGPIFEALAETIRRHHIPLQLFTDLLDAFCQDVRQSRHDTFDDLIDYSQRSANPVGRLVLRLFGYESEALDRQSDAICTALQLTNFWQDIAVDFSRDRIYLPQSMMQAYSVSESDLQRGVVTDGLRALLDDLIARTRALFRAGGGLPESVQGRLRLELRLTWLGGNWILDRIEKVDYDIFHRRPSLGKVAGCGLLMRSLFPLGAGR